MNSHYLTIIYRLTKVYKSGYRVLQFPHSSTSPSITTQSLPQIPQSKDNILSALSRSFLVCIFSSIKRCLYCLQRHFSHGSPSPVCVHLEFLFLIAFSSLYFFILENPIMPQIPSLFHKFFCRFVAHLLKQ